MEYDKQLREFVGHSPIILPGSIVIILNNQYEILLQHKVDGSWGLPGGLMELGESLTDTAKREVFEETGLNVGHLELIDVFSGPDYFYRIRDEDEFYSVTALFVTKDYKGELIADDLESIELKFFKIDEIPDRMSKVYKESINVFKYKQGLGNTIKHFI